MVGDSNEQQLRFRWNDHMQHLSKALTLQRRTEQHCDITLVSEDGFITRAHQAILASSSSYLEKVLSDPQCSSQHPTVVLRGANSRELSCVLDFIYQGSTQVEQDLIESVLQLADLLGVKALSGILANPTIKKFMDSPSTNNPTTSTPTTSNPSTSTAINTSNSTPTTSSSTTSILTSSSLTFTSSNPTTSTPNNLIPSNSCSLTSIPPPNPTPNQVLEGMEGEEQPPTSTNHCNPHQPSSSPANPNPPLQTLGMDLSIGRSEFKLSKERGELEVVATSPLPTTPNKEGIGEGDDSSPPSSITTTTTTTTTVSCKKRKKLEEEQPCLTASLPRTVSLTTLPTPSSGMKKSMERSVELTYDSGPLTISLTTCPPTPAPTHPKPPRPLMPPITPSQRKARRRIRGRRGWLGRGGVDVPKNINTRIRRKRLLTHIQVSNSNSCSNSSNSCINNTAAITTTTTTTTTSSGSSNGDVCLVGSVVGEGEAVNQYCQQGNQEMYQYQPELTNNIENTMTQNRQENDDLDENGDVDEGDDGDNNFPAVSPLALFSLPPPPRPKPKQRRTTLTLEQKVKVVEAFLSGKSQRQIAGLYGTGKTQVSGIIRRRDEILATYRDSLLRGDRVSPQRRRRRGGYARLNQHLMEWYRHAVGVAGARVTAGMLRSKALQLAPQLGYHDFKASNGWLAAFKSNHNLKFSRPGQHSSTPPTAIQEQQPLPQPPPHHEVEVEEEIHPHHRRIPQPQPTFVEEGEAEGSCSGQTHTHTDQEEELTHPCHSPIDPTGLLVHPALTGAGGGTGNPAGGGIIHKPSQMMNSLGTGLPHLPAPYNLSRDIGRETGAGELTGMTVSPLTHPAKPPEGHLAGYKTEEPLSYAYDTQSRMPDPAPPPPRPPPAEYNYTHYGFPSSYYGYHFLGQY